MLPYLRNFRIYLSPNFLKPFFSYKELTDPIMVHSTPASLFRNLLVRRCNQRRGFATSSSTAARREAYREAVSPLRPIRPICFDDLLVLAEDATEQSRDVAAVQ